MIIRQAVKLVDQRDGTKLVGGKVKKVVKTKTATSKRFVPLNSTAIEMILNLRKRLYRIEDVAGIQTKGLYAFRHTFATKLINGTKCAGGSIKTLNIKAVADILGNTTAEITERYLKAEWNHRRIRDMTESENRIPLRMKLNYSQGVSKI